MKVVIHIYIITYIHQIAKGAFWARVSDYGNLRFSRGDPSFNTTFLVVPNQIAKPPKGSETRILVKDSQSGISEDVIIHLMEDGWWHRDDVSAIIERTGHFVNITNRCR